MDDSQLPGSQPQDQSTNPAPVDPAATTSADPVMPPVEDASSTETDTQAPEASSTNVDTSTEEPSVPDLSEVPPIIPQADDTTSGTTEGDSAFTPPVPSNETPSSDTPLEGAPAEESSNDSSIPPAAPNVDGGAI